MHANRQSPSGEDRSPYLRLWCFIGTYRIKRNVDEHIAVLFGGFFGLKDRAALVRATLCAGAVRKLFLMAIRALREARRRQSIVRAAKSGTAR
jgi:hypothetical protein